MKGGDGWWYMCLLDDLALTAEHRLFLLSKVAFQSGLELGGGVV
jgi:hypothetical protein